MSRRIDMSEQQSYALQIAGLVTGTFFGEALMQANIKTHTKTPAFFGKGGVPHRQTTSGGTPRTQVDVFGVTHATGRRLRYTMMFPEGGDSPSSERTCWLYYDEGDERKVEFFTWSMGMSGLVVEETYPESC